MLELLQIFLDNIAPILIIAAIGYGVGRWQRVEIRSLSKLIFYIFSPSLIFVSLSRNRVPPAELAQIGGIMILFVAAMFVIAYGVSRWRGHNRVERAAITLSAICPNNGNYGLPLIGFAFGEDVLARAVLVYVAVAVLNFTAGVLVASSGRKSVRDAILNVIRVPAVYAAIGGLAVNATGIVLPPVLDRSMSLVAQASIPAMLVLLGLQLAQSTHTTESRLVGLGAGLRLLVSPVVAFALVLLLGLNGPASTAVIMQASMPVAVVTIILATEFGLDDKLVSGTVVASTLLSPVTLSLLILALRQPLLP